MDLALARRLVAEARVGRLGTTGPTGQPHLVPCCFALVADAVYTAVDAKPKSTFELRRVRNIADRPEATLLVDHYEEDWSALWWVRLDCRARVVTDPGEEEAARRALTDKYEQYRRVPMPGPVIALDVAGWRSWP
ncbi:MAG TPA: TIGR03668 family PPOX class F420-dependent oxidoreductase [Acidimicrobiales bacterium]|nr:TIGR03668 family PPOX class F420-dependent oxidoreductase [Acidimicrobiales bacterium]